MAPVYFSNMQIDGFFSVFADGPSFICETDKEGLLSDDSCRRRESGVFPSLLRRCDREQMLLSGVLISNFASH